MSGVPTLQEVFAMADGFFGVDGYEVTRPNAAQILFTGRRDGAVWHMTFQTSGAIFIIPAIDRRRTEVVG